MSEQAKEALTNMSPYATSGLRDVDKIIAVTASGGGDPTFKTKIESIEPIVKQANTHNIEQKVAQTRVQNFNNQSNIQAMYKMAADKMQIPQDRRTDPNIVKQISQQVRQDLANGTKYIASGAAKDPETLHRLIELEKKIDRKVNMGGSVGASKAEYVVNADKMLEKADYVLLGGGIANTFLTAQGYDLKKSIYEKNFNYILK